MTVQPAAAEQSSSPRPRHGDALTALAGDGEDLARLLIESAPDGIVIGDADGRIVLVNRQAERIFGYDRAELHGEPVEVLLPQAVRDVHVRHRDRYADDPRVRAMGEGMELQGRRRSGAVFPVEISLSPVRHGERRLTIATVRDVTSRSEAEAEARRAQATLDAVRDAVLVVDARTLRIGYANHGAVEQTGHPRSELLDLRLPDLLPELSEEALEDTLAPLVSRQVTSVTVEAVERRADGSELPVELVLQRQFVDAAVDGPWSLIALARDVSERRAAAGEVRRVRRELALTEDRERIGRELHDTVIQHLFALGMALQAVAPRVEPPDAAARVQATVDGFDDVIRELRTAIFNLQAGAGWLIHGLREELRQEVAHAARTLRFEPSVGMHGELDRVGEGIAEHLLPTVREALSNVARHARATRAEVALDVGEDELVLRIADDGIGLQQRAGARGHGVANMAQRAELLGGSCAVRDATGAPGTVVEWRVPLDGGPA